MSASPRSSSLNGPALAIERHSYLSLNDLEDPDFDKSEKKKCCKGRCLPICACIFIFLTLLVVAAILWIVPAFAKSALNSANVSFNRLEVAEPEGLSSFRMIADMEMESISPFDGTVKSSTMTLKYNDKIIGEVAVPALEIKGGEPVSMFINCTVDLASYDAFNEFAYDAVRNEILTFHVLAPLSLTVSVLGIDNHLSVDMDRDLVVNGANNFPDSKIVHTDLSQSTDSAIITLVTLSINNPSTMSLSPLGVLTFNCFYEGMPMGTLVTVEADESLTLVPGANLVNATQILTPPNTTDPRVSNFFSALLAGNTSVVHAVGGTNATSIPLFRDAFAGLTLSAEMKLNPLPMFVASVDVLGGTLTMHPDDVTALDLTDAHLRIGLNDILGPNCPYSVAKLRASLSIGSIRDPTKVILHQHTDGFITLNQTDKTVIDMVDTCYGEILDEVAMSQVVVDYVLNDTITFALSGMTDAYLDSVIGPIYLHGIPTGLQFATVDGLSNMKNTELTLTTLDIESGASEYLQCEGTLQSSNPGTLGLDMGDDSNTEFHFTYKSTALAVSEAPHFVFPAGNGSAVYPTDMYQTLAPNDTFTEEVFSSYVCGNDFELMLHGTGSTLYPFMNEALLLMKAPVTVKGLSTPLIQNGTMNAASWAIFKEIIPTQLHLLNPFSVEVLITGVDLQVSHHDKEIGYIKETFDEPLRLLPLSAHDTKSIDIHFTMSWTTFESFISGLGTVDVDVEGTMNFAIDDFAATDVVYTQKKIPAHVHL